MKRQAKTQELKISFLIAAHNEEKIIFKTLDNLSNLPYDNYEVIIGLDGCTDSTEKIVKSFEMKSKRFKHFNLNLRQGKPAVINTIIKQATGDIVIINDADWIFQVKDERSLNDIISIFNNPKIGGISENNALEFSPVMESANLGFKMVAYSGQLWYGYQKKAFTRKEEDMLYLTQPTMFLTNIFRRELYKPNVSLGDDFERTKDIMDAGYQIVISQREDAPRFIPVYGKVSIRDLFKLKMRTSLAREQLQETNKMPLPKNYYLSSVFYIFKNSWKYGIKAGMMVSYWIFLTTIATFISKIKSKFKKTSTREGWTMRAER